MRNKACSSCEVIKDLDEFPPDKRCKDARGTKCRACAKEAQIAFYAKYPEKEAERRLTNAAHGAAWYQRNRERQVERMRWYNLERKYGVTKETYLAMLSEQKSKCKICRSDDPGAKDGFFRVDHCHESGAVRGLICFLCNVGLGMFRDNPVMLRAAASYLEETARARSAA